MGVIYKLKKEVVERIVSIKKATPALGCRELAKIVSQEGYLHISKSSVNAVLQEAGLSSSVGRRSLSAQKREEKKFEIPSERKKQIFSNMPTDLAGLKKPAPSAPQAATLPENFPKKPVVFSAQPTQKDFSLSSKTPSKKRVCKNFGVVFLQAVQWEMSARSLLGKYLSEKITNYSAKDIDRLADAVILGSASKINLSEKINDPGELYWHLCGLNKVNSPKEGLRDILNFAQWDTLGMKLIMELPSFLTEIKYIKIFLEDGKFFVMDARQISIGKENVQSGQSALLEKCLDFVAKQILNNVHPVILSTIPTEDQLGVEDFSEAFYSFLYSFENFPGKKMVKIVFYDGMDQEVVVFDAIPEKKRYFIAGLWPWQVKFPELLAEIGQINKGGEQMVVDGLDQEFELQSLEFLFSEDQPMAPEIRGRAIILKDAQTGVARGAVLTNLPTDKASDQEAVSQYLRRWPNLEKGLGFYLFKNIESFNSGAAMAPLPLKAKQEGSLDEFYQQKVFNLRQQNYSCFDTTSLLSNIYDINKILDILKSLLKELACKKYFLQGATEENIDLMNEILPLPASIETAEKYLKIDILLPPGKPFPYRALLTMATKIFNETDLKDEEGRKIILSLSA